MGRKQRKGKTKKEKNTCVCVTHTLTYIKPSQTKF